MRGDVVRGPLYFIHTWYLFFGRYQPLSFVSPPNEGGHGKRASFMMGVESPQHYIHTRFIIIHTGESLITIVVDHGFPGFSVCPDQHLSVTADVLSGYCLYLAGLCSSYVCKSVSPTWHHTILTSTSGLFSHTREDEISWCICPTDCPTVYHYCLSIVSPSVLIKSFLSIFCPGCLSVYCLSICLLSVQVVSRGCFSGKAWSTIWSGFPGSSVCPSVYCLSMLSVCLLSVHFVYCLFICLLSV